MMRRRLPTSSTTARTNRLATTPRSRTILGVTNSPSQPNSPGSNARRRPERRFEVNVADLRKRLGERRFIEIDFMLEPLAVIASRTADSPAVGTLTIESIERGVSVNGQLTIDWVGDCRRCLEPVEGSSTV